MLVKHSTLLDRYARGLPIIGLFFWFIHSKKHLCMAKQDDLAYANTMAGMGAPVQEHLKNHNVFLEWLLIFGSFCSLMIAWYFSYIALNHMHIIIMYFLGMCNAICFEYVIGQALFKAFDLISRWRHQ